MKGFALAISILFLSSFTIAAHAATINGTAKSKAVSIRLSDLPHGYTIGKTGSFPNKEAGQDPVTGGIPGMTAHGRLGAYVFVALGKKGQDTVQAYVTYYRSTSGAKWIYQQIIKNGLSGTRSTAPGVGSESVAFRYQGKKQESHFTTVVFQRGRYVSELELISASSQAPSVQQVVKIARITDKRMKAQS